MGRLGRKPRLSKKTIKEAIKGSGGIITTIAMRLGRSRVQVYNYINKYPDLKQALEEEREKIIDVAEANLIKKLREGSDWATSFTLRTLGKNRGYTTGIEVKGDLTTKIPTPSEVLKEIDKILKKELENED